MTDIDIKDNQGKFKLRVSGVIIKDGKLLVQESKRYVGFCLPGRHVELGENTIDAIKREMKEELKINIEIENLFCVNENIYDFDGKVNQEINYYYKVKPIEKLSDDVFSIKEIDKGIRKEHVFHWIDIKDLESKNFKPLHIAKLLENNKNSSNNVILTDYRN